MPRQAGNLLALASLRLLADRLWIRSVDYKRGAVQMRFAETSPVSPESLVRLASTRRGVSLTPGGILQFDLGVAGAVTDAGRIEAVRDLLQAIGPCDSLLPTIQPSAVRPISGDT